MEVWLEVYAADVLLQINVFHQSMLTLLGLYVLQMPCRLTLLPLQCADLDEHLSYMAIQNFVYRWMNVHLISVVINTYQICLPIFWNDHSVSERPTILNLSNGSKWTKGICVYLHDMIHAWTGIFQYNEPSDTDDALVWLLLYHKMTKDRRFYQNIYYPHHVFYCIQVKIDILLQSVGILFSVSVHIYTQRPIHIYIRGCWRCNVFSTSKNKILVFCEVVLLELAPPLVP